eukprot:TRINITY_DN535_c0_g1_i1.p1 TRINITY_DN535_c0_g1~~TRINITY_DN535_c0_g1_i1.p1  ORF type:complete len:104 (-),score=38.40 TRINITY_DN535_c0_g1_i1:64-330(-)
MAERQRILRVYRRYFREINNYCTNLTIKHNFQLLVRHEFRKQTYTIDQAEKMVQRFKHPLPYIPPYKFGGTAYNRYIVFGAKDDENHH